VSSTITVFEVNIIKHALESCLATASPWSHLYENGDDGTFLNLTGLSREAFEEMHEYLYENVEKHRGAGHPIVEMNWA